MNIYTRAVVVKTMTDAPQRDHWAIFRFGTITIPGDERSRQAPGHGYPEHQQATVEYIAYFDRADWEEAIRTLESDRWSSKNYVAVHVSKPAKTTVHVTVEEGHP